MTDEEIYQQIEEHREEANALYERIHEEVEASIVKHAQVKKRRNKLLTGILSIAAVVLVTLAIVLPIVLQPQEQVVRYGDEKILTREILDCNLKEHYARNNQSLLYLDWYESAEYILTARYYEEGKESSTVYLFETITDDTGLSVEFSVIKRNIVVESLDEMYDLVETTTTIGNTQISYAIQKTQSLAKFEYQGYKYYLTLNDEITLDFLVKTIESMFNN